MLAKMTHKHVTTSAEGFHMKQTLIVMGVLFECCYLRECADFVQLCTCTHNMKAVLLSKKTHITASTVSHGEYSGAKRVNSPQTMRI